MASKNIDKAVREHFNLSDDIRRLIRLANYDLYNGPIGEPDDGKPWPGFSKACDIVKEYMPDGDIWIDDQSDEIMDSEPNWWYPECEDENPDEIYYNSEDVAVYHKRDIVKILVGSELAGYVM